MLFPTVKFKPRILTIAGTGLMHLCPRSYSLSIGNYQFILPTSLDPLLLFRKNTVVTFQSEAFLTISVCNNFSLGILLSRQLDNAPYDSQSLLYT